MAARLAQVAQHQRPPIQRFRPHQQTLVYHPQSPTRLQEAPAQAISLHPHRAQLVVVTTTAMSLVPQMPLQTVGLKQRILTVARTRIQPAQTAGKINISTITITSPSQQLQFKALQCVWMHAQMPMAERPRFASKSPGMEVRPGRPSRTLPI